MTTYLVTKSWDNEAWFYDIKTITKENIHYNYAQHKVNSNMYGIVNQNCGRILTIDTEN